MYTCHYHNHHNYYQHEPRSPLCRRPGPLSPNHEPCASHRPVPINVITMLTMMMYMIIIMMYLMMEMLIILIGNLIMMAEIFIMMMENIIML